MKLDWKAWVGIAITGLLFWWIFRGIDFAEVWTHIRQAHLGYLLVAVVVATAGFLIRALRWKVLLHPVRPDTSLRNRFAAVNIGFMANNLLPARVGEFARAYALSKIEPVPLSTALGSLVVERVLDALVLIAIMVTAMASPSFPAAVSISGSPLARALDAMVVLVILLVLVLTVLVALPRTVVRLVERVATILPSDFARPLVSALESFLGSLVVLRSPRLLLLALAWSVGFWVWHGFSFWLGMLAFDIQAGLAAAFFTEAVVGFGVAIPAAPGFFGTFHASASWALSVFGVPPASSLAFAFGYHLGGFIPVTLIGLYYAGQIGLSLRDVGASGERVEEAVEREIPAARVLVWTEAESGGSAPSDRAHVEAVLVDAPAKINLALHVLARRADGYHDIETLFQAVDLCDRVEVWREGTGAELTVRGDDAGPLKENLALRAARAYLADLGGEPAGVRIRLDKRIPAGAGLGGGSSDAAATLRALDRLFGGAVAPDRLVAMGARLGSDVPFFLGGSPLALARGRGEVLESGTTLPSLPGIVLMPAARMATAEAYRALDRYREARGPGAAHGRLSPPDSWDDVAARARNDFEGVVAAERPGVAEALAALRATNPLLALLCGSGAACFALYRNDRAADQAAAALPPRAGWRCFRIRTFTAWPEAGRLHQP